MVNGLHRRSIFAILLLALQICTLSGCGWVTKTGTSTRIRVRIIADPGVLTGKISDYKYWAHVQWTSMGSQGPENHSTDVVRLPAAFPDPGKVTLVSLFIDDIPIGSSIIIMAHRQPADVPGFNIGLSENFPLNFEGPQGGGENYDLELNTPH